MNERKKKSVQTTRKKHSKPESNSLNGLLCFVLYVNVYRYIPKYELFVRTQNILSGSTIVSAWIGVMSTSHHSSIVAQYHHKRAKLSILTNGKIAFTPSNMDCNNELFPAKFFAVVILLFNVGLVKNNWIAACIPFIHIIKFIHCWFRYVQKHI